MNIALKEKRWEKRKQILIREQKIKEEKAEFKKKNKIPTQKLTLAYIVINCSVIEIYSMVAMWRLRDLSALYALIAAVIGECLSYVTYCAKSSKENQKDGIVYDLAMKQVEPDEGPGR